MLIIRGDEMRDFKPDIYQNSIFDINYDKLYQKGIRCLNDDNDSDEKVLNLNPEVMLVVL